MNFIELAAKRYSVRKFKCEQLSQSVIDRILEAGRIAPTGCNNQPQRILVLNNKESMEKLRTCTRCHFDAPAAMLVCYNKDECWYRPYDNAPSGPVDASIVCTHMMLEAAELGVGTTWVMHFRPDDIKKQFNIPENIVPTALLVMGIPADDAQPFPAHSQSKNINELVVYDKF